jgi:hypothetical protein
MVRLVFRPYTQIRRTICTSVSLRASTRVSPGFALFRHRSPSFGSQQICSYSNLHPRDRIGRLCPLRFQSQRQVAFTFITLRGFKHPKTRTCVRLLGPCFKTGQIRLFRHDREPADPERTCNRLSQSTCKHEPHASQSTPASDRAGYQILNQTTGIAEDYNGSNSRKDHHDPPVFSFLPEVQLTVTLMNSR